MFELATVLGSVAPVLQNGAGAGGPAIGATAAAALAVGLAALGAGIA